MAFELAPLPYAYDALAPFTSAETLEFHHDKHHATYVTNLNNLIKGTEFEGKSLEDVITGSFGKNVPIFNNAAQHYNHHHFWLWQKKGGGGKKIPGKIQTLIDRDLGGYDKFRADFIQAGVTQFGSGWAWLALKDGKLSITKTSNAENPLVTGATPILTADVWEHGYYIDYRNLRLKFLEAFVDHLLNWDYVLERYEAAV
ncbi:superoxide dismutase [Siculibacillus lacustris]|uniref:Superoxide dismutase n=1 Tax=Siculibacillus lacustris TaxID=1549641 RepID=A0A4Q9VX99_9HYPH|nr:superoxide dismutase [Siculibacillus lacustris]TBW41013.1 superoxide dismutase [Siculibacillus lacustris]